MPCDVTVEGNLGSDPEVKFLQSGEQVTELRIAATAGKKNQQGRWEDVGDPLWITASFWGEQNSHLADTLKKGDKVTVTGVLVQRGWEGQDGVRKTSLEVRYPRFKGVIPRRQQQPAFQPPQGGQQGDPWAIQGAPF
jgi:single-strand DNA-binding protein